MVSKTTARVPENSMMNKNWFIHPPFGNWLESIISLVRWKATHGRSYDEIISAVKRHSPKEGWDLEKKSFVKLAVRIAIRDVKNGQ